MEVPLSTVVAAFVGLAGIAGTIAKMLVGSLQKRVEDAELRAKTAEEAAELRAAGAVAAAEQRAAAASAALATERAERLTYVEARRLESVEQNAQLFEMVESIHALGRAATRGAFGPDPSGAPRQLGPGGGGSGSVPTRQSRPDRGGRDGGR